MGFGPKTPGSTGKEAVLAPCATVSSSLISLITTRLDGTIIEATLRDEGDIPSMLFPTSEALHRSGNGPSLRGLNHLAWPGLELGVLGPILHVTSYVLEVVSFRTGGGGG